MGFIVGSSYLGDNILVIYQQTITYLITTSIYKI
jgi:hypothetical protein